MEVFSAALLQYISLSFSVFTFVVFKLSAQELIHGDYNPVLDQPQGAGQINAAPEQQQQQPAVAMQTQQGQASAFVSTTTSLLLGKKKCFQKEKRNKNGQPQKETSLSEQHLR